MMLLANIFGGPDLLIVAVVVLVLFGGKRLPELMRGVGKGLGELQKGIEDSKRVLQSSIEEAHEDPKIHELKPRPAENTHSRSDSVDQAS